MGEPQRDFLALTHGEEWVNFYESFDKLVQDNLARSSDLLKRAMTLPEVADREVAKIKDEHEVKLTDERTRHRATLSDLRDEVANSERQISALTRGMGGLLGDLERLGGRINSALASVEPTADVPAELPIVPLAAVKPQTAPLTEVAKPKTAPLAEVAKPQTAPLTEVAKPQTGPLAAAPSVASQPEVEADAAIDLNALAEAETEQPAEEAPAEELVAATNGGGERQRPHWLSVTRPNTTGNN